MQRDIVTVERFYTDQSAALELKLVAGANGLKRVIREPTVNRPGLVLSGFTRYFANKRMQVIGNAEALQRVASSGPLENLFHRVSQPEDVAGVILFLCLPASRQITGQTIHTSAGAVV